jgi:hypothetical protein
MPVVGNSHWLYIQRETNEKLKISNETKLWDLCRYPGAVTSVNVEGRACSVEAIIFVGTILEDVWSGN